MLMPEGCRGQRNLAGKASRAEERVASDAANGDAVTYFPPGSVIVASPTRNRPGAGGGAVAPVVVIGAGWIGVPCPIESGIAIEP